MHYSSPSILVCLDELVVEVAYLAFKQHYDYEPLDYSLKKYAFMYMDTMLAMSSLNTFNIRVHLMDHLTQFL